MMVSWAIMKLDRIKEIAMKKVMVLVFFIIFLFAGCVGDCEFKVGEQMSRINSKFTPYITMNALSVYENTGDYLIVIDDGYTIQKLVEFSSERKAIKIQGLELIKCEDIKQFLDMSIQKLQEKYGQPHVDIGSGFNIPSYITEDGYLICLQLENDIVFEVIKRDLLTNEVIACISNY